MPTRRRLLPLVVLGATVLSLGLLTAVSQAAHGELLIENSWRLAGYFTVLTSLGVVAVMLAEVLGHPVTARLAGGLTLAIVMVALVYHLVLARLWNPVGLAMWADQGLHSAVPGLTLLWWLLQAPKSVSLRDLPVWLIWPAVYLAYALGRGLATGFWPYPFLDIGTVGWQSFAFNVAMVAAAFAGMGLCLIWVARRLIR